MATQAFANPSHGPAALDLLAKGVKPDEAAKQLLDKDAERETRQMGIVSAKGEAAIFTGKDCIVWAGGVSGKNYCIQGNILAGEAVIKAMEKSFLESKGEMGERLIAALAAGRRPGATSAACNRRRY